MTVDWNRERGQKHEAKKTRLAVAVWARRKDNIQRTEKRTENREKERRHRKERQREKEVSLGHLKREVRIK